MRVRQFCNGSRFDKKPLPYRWISNIALGYNFERDDGVEIAVPGLIRAAKSSFAQC